MKTTGNYGILIAAVLFVMLLPACVTDKGIRPQKKAYNESRFTSLDLKDCKSFPHPKISALVLCQGKSRYKVAYRSNRKIGYYIYIYYSYSMINDNEPVSTLKRLKLDGLKIHRVGKKAEWRMAKKGLMHRPVSVIIPVFATPTAARGRKPSKYYVVAKLATEKPGPCVISRVSVKQGQGEDRQHRMAVMAADSKDSKCLR